MKSRALLLALGCGQFVLEKGSCFLPTFNYDGSTRRWSREHIPFFLETTSTSDDVSDDHHGKNIKRRTLLSWGLASTMVAVVKPANAARQSSLFLVTTKNTTSAESLRNEPVDVDTKALSSELCLLKLLPIKNPVFRTLEDYVEGVSSLRSAVKDTEAWRNTNRKLQSALLFLDNKRGQLQPVFNQEDSTILQITKGERGERLIENFRNELIALIETTRQANEKNTFRKQKDALLALADIGELLVASFPYDIPTEGKFSFLPRLLGRARVTFSFRRDNAILGNVTIIADGFAAPLTAGNFVDLSLRQFYTGLPIKSVKKQLAGRSPSIVPGFRGIETIEEKILGIEMPAEEDSEAATVPILGSFQEGFYDPLTAKPRRIPLEIVRLDKGEGTSKLSYARGFSDLSAEASVEPSKNNQPLLSFEIQGLVALNHPDKNLNGGSAEFFSLQTDTLPQDKRKLFDGQYAPFGYIIDGFDLFQTLKPGDVIDSTTVCEWGQLNLVKVRGTSFSDVMQSEDGA